MMRALFPRPSNATIPKCGLFTAHFVASFADSSSTISQSAPRNNEGDGGASTASTTRKVVDCVLSACCSSSRKRRGRLARMMVTGFWMLMMVTSLFLTQKLDQPLTIIDQSVCNPYYSVEHCVCWSYLSFDIAT